MKKYFILAASALALAGCSSDDYLGGDPGNENGGSAAINFGSSTGIITRANKEGKAAADLLKNHFVVFGSKTTDGNTTTSSATQTVYDHYDVQWVGNDADKKTQSNQAGWEYVGYTPNKNSNLNGSTQSIKYWDYSASEYDFVAFSLGELTSTEKDHFYDNQEDVTTSGTVEDGKVRISKIEGKATKYSITGKVENIAKLYISDRITAKSKDAKESDINYNTAVRFNFRALKTLVRIGIFETIPGYSVKDVKFYASDGKTSGTPGLYSSEETIPAGYGTATVTFGTGTKSGDYNKALVAWESSKNSKDINFAALTLKGKEKNEEAGDTYLGRTNKDASLPAEYTTVIPSAEVGALNLKVDYTLVSTDGSGEQIKVTGASAVVPAEYTKWQPNYSYTYIFKISDKTNGSTGGDSKGLYPITFDAVVTETSEGIQNTITTVSDPSITTYAKGNDLNEEYKSDDNIYASVTDASNGETAALYKENEGVNTTYTYYATLYKLTTGETITEAEAADVLAATGKTLGGKTLKEEGNRTAETLDSRFVNKIDATDAVDGVEVAGNFFKFKVEAGTYVFAYEKDNAKVYKVIVVK